MILFFDDGFGNVEASKNNVIIASGELAKSLYRSQQILNRQLENKNKKLTNPLAKTNFDNNLLGVKINYE